jgi:hypothetical protein
MKIEPEVEAWFGSPAPLPEDVFIDSPELDDELWTEAGTWE